MSKYYLIPKGSICHNICFSGYELVYNVITDNDCVMTSGNEFTDFYIFSFNGFSIAVLKKYITVLDV